MLWVLCFQEMRQESHRCGGIVSLKLEEALGFSHWQNLLLWEKALINLEKRSFHFFFHGYLGYFLGSLLLEGKSVIQGAVFSLAPRQKHWVSKCSTSMPSST